MEIPEIKSGLVYAVVTHWNGLDDTIECIESILVSSYSNVSIVIVDNGSTDGSPQVLAERYPFIKQVHTGVNGAVTRAYNMGIQYGLDNDAQYILMLNNDTVLERAMIALLVDAAEEDASIGVVTPKTYYYKPSDIIWFAGGDRSRFDFGAVNTFRGEIDSAENSIAKEVDYAWASGMLMRQTLLDTIGLFDTRFFLYYDDVDISLRAVEAGFRIWYVPDAKMWHKVSQSTGNPRFTRIWARSKMRLYRKHANGFHLLLLIPYAFLHGVYRLTFPDRKNKKKYSHPRAYFLGLIDGLKTWDNDSNGDDFE